MSDDKFGDAFVRHVLADVDSKKAKADAAPTSAETCKPSSPAPTAINNCLIAIPWQRRAAERIEREGLERGQYNYHIAERIIREEFAARMRGVGTEKEENDTTEQI